MEKETKLNTRQWELYGYLKTKDDWVALSEIMTELGKSSYRLLKSDIRVLRASKVLQKPIMTDTVRGVKLATKNEYEAYSGKRWKAIINMIRLQKYQDKKAGLDGQYRLVFGREKPVVESFMEVR